MITTKPAKEIAGKITLPTNPDLVLLGMCAACASNKKISFQSIQSTPLIEQYKALFAEHLQWHDDGSQLHCTPQQSCDDPIYIPFATLPFVDFIVFSLLACGKILIVKEVTGERIGYWQARAKQFCCTINAEPQDEKVRLWLGESNLSIPQEMVDANDLSILFGLAWGLHQSISFEIDYPLQTPLRHLAIACGYNCETKSTIDRSTKDPLARHMRFFTQKTKGKKEQKQSFIVTADFTNENDEAILLDIPGDDILASLLLLAKSLVQKGLLVMANVPSEQWASSMLNLIRKMQCPVGIQDERDSSFGTTAMVSLQKFKLVGRKVECTPLSNFERQLPAMAILANFASGQSVFRGLEGLRLDNPDRLKQLLLSIEKMGGRHGEMPDGVVIDGGQPSDGFDLTEHFTVSLNGSCAMAGLKCNGQTVVEDTQLLQRWPDFNSLINTMCTFRE